MRCHPGEILGWHEEPLLVTLEEPARRSPEALLAIGLEELPQERQIEDSKPGRRLDELLQAPDAIGMPEPVEQRALGARDAKAPAAPIDTNKTAAGITRVNMGRLSSGIRNRTDGTTLPARPRWRAG